METTHILDQELTPIDGAAHVKINLASAGQRFGNYIIDRIMCYLILAASGVLIEVLEDTANEFIYLLPFALLLAYFILMETFFGKTIGKFITGTKVVTTDGQKPEIGAIIGRTFCRIIPFDVFSFLGSKAIGWHDSIPGTRVIRDR